MLQNQRRYGPHEYPRRLRIFLGNKRRIEEHNAGNHSFQMGLNQFSDLTFAEFKKLYLWSEPQPSRAGPSAASWALQPGLQAGTALQGSLLQCSVCVGWSPVPHPVSVAGVGHWPGGQLSTAFLPRLQNCSATKGNFLRSSGPYPDSIDWRKKGNFVTPVKNQGACGSCWTFSTTGCLESAIAIATGKLLSLAEQQLVDCAQAFNNHGCSGGLPSQAFEYILYNKGLMGEDTYPYRAKNGTCKFQPDKAIAFVKDVINITQYDEDSMVEAVGKHNPVSFAFEVTSDFMHYRKGVYSNPRCEHTPDKVNHAVLAVGYGEEDGTPHWIVKNSWGRLWGMQGSTT
ncbi:hypothetical protein IHE44_0002938 [Lamprotornis superbus]|uniref:Cathepsin H n=1 Tax=Lamprotornis superbus TaxID=245042 RepID=A0A835NFT5_9PASS|nr:hypothetical protein IHE44_0002938 [Lamprotornis superbus]